MATNTRKGTPGKTLLGFSAVLGCVAVLNVRDRVYRASHEEWYFPTAIGDEELFSVYEGLSAGASAVDFEGQALIMKEKRLVLRADWAMEKTGRDDEDSHFIYREGGGGSESEGSMTYFLKVKGATGDDSHYLAIVPATTP